MANQENFPDIYLDESVAPGGVGSFADPYSDFSEINWPATGDNSITDYYAGSPTASVTLNLRKDQEWRETLDNSHAGTAAYPIIQQAYGVGDDPIVNGSDLVGDVWSLHDATMNIWKTTASITTECEQLWINNLYGRRRNELTTEVDTLIDPITNTNFDCNADFHIRTTFVHEIDKLINIRVRWTSDDDCIFLRIGASGNNGLRLSKNDSGGGNEMIKQVTDLLEDGVKYTVEFTGYGSALKVYLETPGMPNTFGQLISEVDSFQSTTAQGHLDHDHTSIDCDVWAYSFSGGFAMIDDGDWWWDSSTVYLVSSGGNPNTQYISPGVEIDQRDQCIDVGTDDDYIIIDGLRVSKSKIQGIRFWNCSYSTVRNCMAEWCWGQGIQSGGSASIGTDILFEDNTGRYCGNHGINVKRSSYGLANVIVRRNTAYLNGYYTYNVDGEWDTMHEFSGGMKLWTDDQVSSNIKVYGNWLRHNGPGEDYAEGGSTSNGGGKGNGLWFDSINGSSGDEIKCFFNLLTDNTGPGLHVEIMEYLDGWSNVLINNSLGKDFGDYSSANIKLASRDAFNFGYVNIYNNSVYGGNCGLMAHISGTPTSTMSNCNVRNNIFAECLCAIYAGRGGDNGTYGSGNYYADNQFLQRTGDNSKYFATYDDVYYTTYATWAAVINGLEASSVENNDEGDPLYTNPGNYDLTLQPGSPCIGTGADLGDDTAEGLRRMSMWLRGIRSIKQDYLGAWERGAFVVEDRPWYKEYSA